MAMFFEHFYELFGYRTAVAEWASIFALFISAYAAYAITRVRSQILGRVRLPALVSGIEKNTAALAALMRDFEENKEQVGLELAICEANLRLLSVSVKGRPRTSANAIVKDIKRYDGRTFFGTGVAKGHRDGAWSIYKSLNALIEELKHVLEDQRVGG